MSSGQCKPSVSGALLDWYRDSARDLPWRHTTEPYAIWISEIMLQQTQVKTVLPHYRLWFEKFPDIAALAEARIDDVLKAWEGLGYYRRARFIHAAARQIVAEHGGIFPEAFDDILRLPGVGRSTAGAIASFCFAASTPVLDGNVKRVLKRWHGLNQATDTMLWPLALQALDASGKPSDWNQAMMELGESLCSARAPLCDQCPVAAYCTVAFQVDETQEKRKAAAVRDVYWQVMLHTCPQRGIWLIRRPAAGIWGGLWAPPIYNLVEAPGDATAEHVHLLSHRRLHLYAEICSDEPTGEGAWVSDISAHALPTGIHHLFEKAGVIL